MADYHTVYGGARRETTEWGDMQRALGNLPGLPPEGRPDAYAPPDRAEVGKKRLDAMGEGELDGLGSSSDDLADDRALAAYRKQRLAELKAEAAARRRFGDLRPMSAAEWTKEVTEASEECRVVVLMEHAGDAPSDALAECLVAIAKRCPRTKFVRVPATDAVPRYPQRLCPTVIVYHKGDVVQNIAGRELAVFGGAKRLTPESVELVLERCGALDGEEGRGGAGAREERALQAAARAMADQLAEEERTEAEERARDEEEP